MPAASASGALRVGVGRADITPLTNGYKGGWSCTCAKVVGQQERLYARAVVLDEGGQRVALVAEDLFALSAGMVRDAAGLLPGLGLDESNIVDAATHDHSSPSGYMSFSAYNSILPSNSNPDFSGVTQTAADPAKYSFMTRQLALAIRRAAANLAPGAAGWGQVDLLGVTENRSLGAHLAGSGVPGFGAEGGATGQDPGGYPGTIDPAVSVLRVDQIVRHRHVPLGMFSVFANHGTVDHENFWLYSGDHLGAAERVAEAAVRRIGHVPAAQDVINAYANGDAGDVTAGIDHVGPAAAEDVGRREAAAMVSAWRRAGASLSTHPALALRWTRVCFCGQPTRRGEATDSTPWIGKAAGAGSEEGRTIFYESGLAREGDRLPVDGGPQGDKITVLDEKGSLPQAVPYALVRIGDGLIATVPGEPTVGVGTAVRAALAPILSPAGIRHVTLVGYAGDYLSYFTTPQEYEVQAYEGGFTLFGEYSSLLVADTLTDLARSLASGTPASAPYAYDPSGGTALTAATYSDGAGTAEATAQPAPEAQHLGHAHFAWTGGAEGIDRPVDRAFVTVQRLARGGQWRQADDDLGMAIEWTSDAKGAHEAHWEVPLGAAPGRYRFLVTGKRYRLVSSTFTVAAGAILTPTVRGATVTLAYPQPYLLNDWTYRPVAASAGTVTFLVGANRRVVVRSATGRFPTPSGGENVIIPAGAVRDRYGDTNPAAVTVRAAAHPQVRGVTHGAR